MDGNAIDPNAVVDGDELYLDLQGSTEDGSATVTVNATGSTGTGNIISVPTTSGGTPTPGDHAQTILLVENSVTTVTESVTVALAAPVGPATPEIGTPLVDSADGDQIVAWDGGTVIDTVAYRNLIPGTEYTLTGALMDAATGEPTGITGSTVFTPTEADGEVEVTFVIPAGFDGKTLVAFESLHVGTDTDGEPIAEHTDLEDAAQTVTVEDKPEEPVPSEPVPSEPESGEELPKTGNEPLAGAATLALIAMLVGAGLIAARSRKLA